MRLKLAYGSGQLWIHFPKGASVNVSEVLQSLKNKDPELYKRLCDKDGQLRDSVVVLVNSEHIRYRQGMETELNDGDELYLIPMIAGG